MKTARPPSSAAAAAAHHATATTTAATQQQQQQQQQQGGKPHRALEKFFVLVVGKGEGRSAGLKQEVLMLNHQLLREQLTPQEYVQAVSTLLHVPVAAGLTEKITTQVRGGARACVLSRTLSHNTFIPPSLPPTHTHYSCRRT